jgi:hypothetical protein
MAPDPVQMPPVASAPTTTGKETTLSSSNGISVVGWITLSFINAGLAQAKGRSGWYWWLISILLGPLATALIVVWPRPAPLANADR